MFSEKEDTIFHIKTFYYTHTNLWLVVKVMENLRSSFASMEQILSPRNRQSFTH